MSVSQYMTVKSRPMTAVELSRSRAQQTWNENKARLTLEINLAARRVLNSALVFAEIEFRDALKQDEPLEAFSAAKIRGLLQKGAARESDFTKRISGTEAIRIAAPVTTYKIAAPKRARQVRPL
jgi:hypothetical protein